MSHFTVLVIGDEPERQLQPFHEYECTGTNDEYVQDVDITEQVRAQMSGEPDSDKEWDKPKSQAEALEYFGITEKHLLTEGAPIDREGAHQWHYAIVNAKGELLQAIDRTNPNKKWDWYRLGGRWKGMLLLKNGQESDQALVRDIDFRAMRDRAEQKAVELYRYARSLLASVPEPRSWEAIRSEHDGDIAAARKVFHGQEAYRLAREDKRLLHHAFEGCLEEFWWPESRHVFRARKEAFSTFAVLKDGTWYERGRTGWWGVVHNEQDTDEWLSHFETLVESLAPDTLISIYDCHI